MFYSNEDDLEKTFVEGSLPAKKVPSLPINEYSSSSISDEDENSDEPKKLGTGDVIEILGCGGSARVYKIWNEKLEIYRAVKLLLDGSHQDFRSRFETEAKITAKLHHPNIVEIYNIDEWRGRPFIEMEFVEGTTLQQFLREVGKLPDIVCMSIALGVAAALHHAHKLELDIYGKKYNGIIHRDLKPANILLSFKGEVKLGDFGIARPVQASLHTMEGSIVGTLHYLSPEQMDGEDIDCRSDIYSFGTILYEMLTGVKTFPQDRLSSLMKSRMLNNFKKPSDFDFPISSALSKIMLRCLENDPEKRFPDMEKLLNELYTAHKKLTDLTPEYILQSFIKQPGISFPIMTKNKAFPLKALAVCTVLSASLIAFLLYPNKAVSLKHPIENLTPLEKFEDSLQLVSIDEVKEESSVDTQPAVDLKNQPVKVSSQLAEKVSLKTEQHPVTPKNIPKKTNIDPVTAGREAYSQKKWKDAVKWLSEAHVQFKGDPQITLMLLEACLESGGSSQSFNIAESIHIEDAQFYLLKGRMLQKSGNPQIALKNLELSLTKPSTARNRTEICRDALYYIAEVRGETLQQSPTAKNRTLALVSWNKVMNIYSSSPENARYKKAEAEIVAISQLQTAN